MLTAFTLLLVSLAVAFVPGESDLPQARVGFDPNHAGMISGTEHIDLFSGAVNIAATDVCIPGGFGLPMCVTRTYSSKVVNEASEPIDSSWAGLGWTVLVAGRLRFDSVIGASYLRVQLPGGPEQLAWLLDPSDTLFRAATDLNAFPNQTNTDPDVWVTADYTFLYHDGNAYYALASGGLLYTFDTGSTHNDGWIYGERVENPWGDALDVTYHACAETMQGGAIDTVNDALGRTLTFGVDGQCELESASWLDDDGATVGWTYDVEGVLTSATSPTGESTGYAYESTWNELETVTLPTGGSTTYTYDTFQILSTWYATAYDHGEIVQPTRMVTTKTVSDGMTSSVWEYQFDDYHAGSFGFGVLGPEATYRATRVIAPSGAVVDHYYGTYCYTESADGWELLSNCMQRSIGQPIGTLWYDQEGDTTPRRWVYYDYADSGQTTGTNAIDFTDGTWSIAEPYGGNADLPGNIVPRAIYEGQDTAYGTGDSARVQVFGQVSDGDYDVYGNALSVASGGYAPYEDLSTANQYYFDETRSTWAWSAEPALEGWNLTRLPSQVIQGYPDGVGGIAVTWSDTTTTWSTNPTTIGWPLRTDSLATGTEDSNGDGLSSENPSADRYTTWSYLPNPATGSIDVTVDHAGLRTELQTVQLGTVVSHGWVDGVSTVVFQTADVDENTGRVHSITDAAGNTTRYGWDASGRLTGIRSPASAMTTWSYNLTSSPPTIRQTRGTTAVTWTYDGLGRLVKTNSPNGDDGRSYLEQAYDEDGRLSQVWLPHAGTRAGYTETTFDGLGRAETGTRTDGTTTYTSSTSYSWPTTTHTNALGHSTTFTLDGRGNISLTAPPLGATLVSAPSGTTRHQDRIVLTSGTGVTQTQTRSLDQEGAPWRIDDAQSGWRAWEKDAAGDVVCESDENGDYTATTYDFAGRADAVYYSSDCTGSATPDIQWYYDGAIPPGAAGWTASGAEGKVSGMEDEAGWEVYDYDREGRVRTQRRFWNAGAEADLSYRYDAEGNLQTMTWNDRYRLVVDYAAGGRVTAMRFQELGPADRARETRGLLDAVHYHPDGTVAEITHANGVIETREQDGFGRTTLVSAAGADSDPYWETSWNAGDQLQRLEGYQEDVDYFYDALGRLTNADDLYGAQEHFGWDDFGNLTDMRSDRVADFAGATYTANRRDGWGYDGVGNLTTDENGLSFTYNHRGQVVEATDGDGLDSVQTEYDGNGRRAHRTELELWEGEFNGWAYWHFEEREELYLYDTGGRLAAKYLAESSSGAAPRPRLHELYFHLGDRLIGTYRVDLDELLWVHQDGLGNVRAVSDAWLGPAYSSRYAAFGMPVDEDTSDEILYRDFAWAGHGVYDKLDLADFGNRSMHLGSMRFSSPDRVVWGSAGDPQSFNRYAYGMNAPHTFADDGDMPLLLVAWGAVEVGLSIADVAVAGGSMYAAATGAGTWGAAAFDVAAAAFGIVGPGGGYAVEAKTARTVTLRLARAGEDLAPSARRAAKKWESTSWTKKVPNPGGKMGGAAHQAKVADVARDITDRGLKVGFERRVPTPGGGKSQRWMDVVALDATGAPVEFHQIGRKTANGLPVVREARAISDVQMFSNYGNVPIMFHAYN